MPSPHAARWGAVARRSVHNDHTCMRPYTACTLRPVVCESVAGSEADRIGGSRRRGLPFGRARACRRRRRQVRKCRS
eukprot:1248956-Alexandrium_andersonii.AAC.1